MYRRCNGGLDLVELSEMRVFSSSSSLSYCVRLSSLSEVAAVALVGVEGRGWSLVVHQSLHSGGGGASVIRTGRGRISVVHWSPNSPGAPLPLWQKFGYGVVFAILSIVQLFIILRFSLEITTCDGAVGRTTTRGGLSENMPTLCWCLVTSEVSEPMVAENSGIRVRIRGSVVTWVALSVYRCGFEACVPLLSSCASVVTLSGKSQRPLSINQSALGERDSAEEITAED
ncbi:hypothetical protein Sjap_001385 [Stephania japonica]|uniref:Uncharacterized protein n=1 Tax=Stephania japonica TaxID=461633 RepID=A0AAP0KKS0_9MAGN